MQRIALLVKSFERLIVYPILSKPHLVHLKYCLLGFWHGITKKMGKLNE
jgi:rhamnosyltransferase